MARRWWVLWTAGMVGFTAALTHQVSYTATMHDCVIDAQDRLILCAGPLPDWLLPITVAGGLTLTALAAMRLMASMD